MEIKFKDFDFVRIKYFDEIENIEKALKIYKTNEEFFNLLSIDEIGKKEKITKKTVIKDLEMLPPNKESEDKYFGLILDNEKVIGVIDLIDGYPRKDIAYIGLFVIDKPLHRKGIGKKLYFNIENMLKENKYSAVMLGVLKTNKKGQDFWNSLDFKTVKETKDYFEMKKKL